MWWCSMRHQWTKRLVTLSLLLAMAIILGYLESLIPSFGIPGVKIGLANIVILLCVINFKYYESFAILILRILVVSLILGTFLQVSFFMSLAGGLFSFIVMFVLSKLSKNLSYVFISISGAISHSIGQIIVALIVTSTVEVFYYLPFILLLSIPTGILTGIIAKRISKLKIMEDLSEKE